MAAWTGPCLILTLAVCLTFGKILRHDFVEWDDPINVTNNPHLTELSWHKVARFWREPYFTRYTPLSYTLYAAQAWLAPLAPDALGQPALNPAVFHAGSLLLHLACVLLVYRLIVLFVGDGLPACFGALLFAVHPLQAESVSWVSGQGGLLSTLFSLVALLLYARCRLGRSDTPGEQQSSLCGTAFYLAATLAYVAALLSKPSAACIPLLAAVLDRCWLQRSWRSSALLLGPWCLLAVATFLITRQEQSGDTPPFVPPLAWRFLIAGDALSFYLSKLFWPAQLIIQYPRSPRIVMAGHWIYFAWLVPASLLALAIRFRSRGPWLLCAGLFIGALAPVLGLIPFDFQQYSTVADRYAYLALLGPALAAAWWIHGHPSKPNLTIAALLLLLLAGATYRQTGYWRDSETLFTRTIEINPGSHLSHNNLALEYLKTGEPRLAAHHAELALELKPDSVDARFVRALAQSSLGQIEAAIQEYEQILSVRPAYTEARLNRAVLEYRLGRVESAIEQYRELLKRSPDSAIAHRKLGGVLAAEGQLKEALSHLSRAVEIAPQDASAHAELARVLAIDEQPKQAIAHYRTSLALRSPEWPLVATRLAQLLATHPDPSVRSGQDALRLAQAACQQTDYAAPELLQTLAAAHAELGQFEDAVSVANLATAKAREQGNQALVEELQRNLALYTASKPWRVHPREASKLPNTP